uniref:Uncharacterized protein n=1 Tax=Udotea flabellum TaxID=170437 RepID=A0A386B1W1_9CHLO|nr:hypothetical protein [Udotea flabellum]AYC65682.1 hypothetical protein [Udotea flabellum]
MCYLKKIKNPVSLSLEKFTTNKIKKFLVKKLVRPTPALSILVLSLSPLSCANLACLPAEGKGRQKVRGREQAGVRMPSTMHTMHGSMPTDMGPHFNRFCFKAKSIKQQKN